MKVALISMVFFICGCSVSCSVGDIEKIATNESEQCELVGDYIVHYEPLEDCGDDLYMAFTDFDVNIDNCTGYLMTTQGPAIVSCMPADPVKSCYGVTTLDECPYLLTISH